MKFEFPDEDIMTLDNCEESRPYDGPEQGSRWTLFFDGASNELGNGITAILISPEGCHTLLGSSAILLFSQKAQASQRCTLLDPF